MGRRFPGFLGMFPMPLHASGYRIVPTLRLLMCAVAHPNCFRYAPGNTPTTLLNARVKAATDW